MRRSILFYLFYFLGRAEDGRIALGKENKVRRTKAAERAAQRLGFAGAGAARPPLPSLVGRASATGRHRL